MAASEPAATMSSGQAIRRNRHRAGQQSCRSHNTKITFHGDLQLIAPTQADHPQAHKRKGRLDYLPNDERCVQNNRTRRCDASAQVSAACRRICDRRIAPLNHAPATPTKIHGGELVPKKPDPATGDGQLAHSGRSAGSLPQFPEIFFHKYLAGAGWRPREGRTVRWRSMRDHRHP
jgi:hypothetical protein